jgi:hypothetical protein
MVAWSPVRADEINGTADRFAKQTFETKVQLRTSAGLKQMPVSIFNPKLSENANAIQVHVFFSPGGATETGVKISEVGLNAVNMHGMRGSSDRSSWILISVPGIVNGFAAIDEDAICACLSVANGGVKYAPEDIYQIRLSGHSRGASGLAQSVAPANPKAKVPAKPLPVAKIDRVVVFDAADLADGVLAGSGIPGSKQFAYQVNVAKKLSAKGATNVAISPSASRAIGYSRLIADLPTTGPMAGTPVPSYSGTLLTLPPRTKFTTKKGSGMTDINAFAATNKKLIDSIVKDELSATGAFKFIDDNNITRMGSYPPGIMSHHLFVAELAHEIVD